MARQLFRKPLDGDYHFDMDTGFVTHVYEGGHWLAIDDLEDDRRYTELMNMLEKKDTLLDMYRTQLGKQDTLIRGLLAALAGASGGFLTGTTVSCNVEAAIAKAKAAGFEP